LTARQAISTGAAIAVLCGLPAALQYRIFAY